MIILLLVPSLFNAMHFGIEGKVGAMYGSYVPPGVATPVGGLIEFSLIGWYENTGFEGILGIGSGPETQVWAEALISKNLGSEKEGKLLVFGLGYYGVGGGSPGLVLGFQYQMLRDKWVNIIPQIKMNAIYGRQDALIRYNVEFLIGIALVM